MFGTGRFAQIAKVSPRTLRHYDEVGLARPTEVDKDTGYRFYSAAQLARLNRILVLKDLGFTLAEITRMIESGVTTEEMVGMLRLRRTESARAIEDERRRLARVAARIELLQGETTMSDENADIVIKALDPMRVATVSETASGFDADFGPIFDRLYPELFGELGRLGVTPDGVPIALYEERSDGEIDVIAGVAIAPVAEVDSVVVTVRDLPAVERAATLIHCGEMATIETSYRSLDRWVSTAGEKIIGFSREIYLDCDGPQTEWVTELQFVLE